jgi:uncharacterized protein HemX
VKNYLTILSIMVALTAAASFFAFIRVQDVQSQQNAAITVLHAQTKEAIETHRGVCAFRSSLQDQVRSSEKYLRQHPSGAPSLHISAAQIEQSISREKKTIHALRDLNCPHS